MRHQRVVVPVGQQLRHRSKAVRRVRETVEEQRGAADLGRDSLLGAIPVLVEARGVARAVAYEATPELLGVGYFAQLELDAQLAKELGLLYEVGLEGAHRIGVRGVELLGQDGPLPGLEIGLLTAVEGAHKHHQDDTGSDQEQDACEPSHRSAHRPPGARPRGSLREITPTLLAALCSCRKA